MADATLGKDQARQVRIFINYRHDDTKAEAALLHERLVRAFGGENVFLDGASIPLGGKWLEEIKSHIDSCHIFLTLIGPRWVTIMRQREQNAILDPAEDYVRLEIERALRWDSGARVIPVLVESSKSLGDLGLPGSLQALRGLQAASFRTDDRDSDAASLISRIGAMAQEAMAQEQAASVPEAAAAPGEQRSATRIPVGQGNVAQEPDAAHYSDVLACMVDHGNLVFFLGARMAAERGGAADGPESLPSTELLAQALAERFGIKRPAPLDLPEIAQYVYVTQGRSDLWKALKQLPAVNCDPGPVHRFLARLPGVLAGKGHPDWYPLIVSTNFDTALEKAFDDAGVPYDLAVYMASGRDKGKFVHFPADGDPRPIGTPNEYNKFPIGRDNELWRTVIVKIHGAIDGNIREYRWQDNYVITEDNYIDYLSRSPIEDLVPLQILDKLRDSHCLFLGYAVRDWNLRVFLKRVWDTSPGGNSWAVEPEPDILEKRLWAANAVELYASDVAAYVDGLGAELNNRFPDAAGS
jgi:SIR2-like domain/TIR domain